MRARTLAAAALAVATLSGCIVVDRRAPREYAAPVAAPAPAPVPAGISRERAIDVAFHAARQRGLDVDRIHHANRDGSGRWHVDVRGRRDRAKVLVDARDGRVLRLDTKDR